MHLIQVGAGSGGMVVLDLVGRDPRVTALTLIEPDIYKPHNVERHYFATSACGRFKAELAREWLLGRRPDLEVRIIMEDLTNPARQNVIEEAVMRADVGVCAVDNEPAKYHWDSLMRKYRKPWTLGEVLSGGIGGFVHTFTPDGPCYGCVASHLQRSVETEQPRTPDYAHPGGAVAETRIPADKAAIHAIASLHALATLPLLDPRTEGSPARQKEWTSLLLTLRRVPEVFEEAFRPYRFCIPRNAACLICGAPPPDVPAEDLDVALDRALERLAGAAGDPSHA